MRAISIARPPAGPQHPIPTEPSDQESVAVTWCRHLATAVATALTTTATAAGYRLTFHPRRIVPHLLHTTFTVAGHRVAVTVLWPAPGAEPGCALAVDDHPVTLDPTQLADPALRPAAVLARAAAQAVRAGHRAGVR